MKLQTHLCSSSFSLGEITACFISVFDSFESLLTHLMSLPLFATRVGSLTIPHKSEYQFMVVIVVPTFLGKLHKLCGTLQRLVFRSVRSALIQCDCDAIRCDNCLLHFNNTKMLS